MAENTSKPKVETLEHLEHVKNNYLSIWNGNLSLINSTFAPTISFSADRFPSSSGSQAIDISTREAFHAFVTRSRTGWDKYEFEVYAWTGNENHLAVRWVLDGVMGASFNIVPTWVSESLNLLAFSSSGKYNNNVSNRTLKPGDPVTYNGTDFLILNKETGLIEELHMAQDLITLFHNLGLTGITVWIQREYIDGHF